MWQAFGLVGVIGLAIGVYCLAIPSAQVAMPIVAFACAASARLLQRVNAPLLWLVGTAGPLFIAWYVTRSVDPDRVLPGAHDFFRGPSGLDYRRMPPAAADRAALRGRVFNLVATTGR